MKKTGDVMNLTKMQKYLIVGSVATLITSGCGSFGDLLPSSQKNTVDNAGSGHLVYQGHDFGTNRDADYKSGVIDGCKTASGTYTKNHQLFRNNQSYKAGWISGRMECGKSAN